MAYASWSVVFGEQPSAAKWNILGTNDASFNDGTGIADSAILPKHLLTGTGSANWAYASHTPTITNFTTGNGTISAGYRQIGKHVHANGRVTVGSTSSFAGVITLTLPVTSVSTYASREPLGVGMVFDTSAAAYAPLFAIWISTTTFRLVALTTLTGANPVFSDIATARDVATGTPVTFAVGDIFSWNFAYEVA